MKLVTSLQLALGLIATSGVAICLSGSAWAAEGGVVASPQAQVSPQTSELVTEPDTAAVVATAQEQSSLVTSDSAGSGLSAVSLLAATTAVAHQEAESLSKTSATKEAVTAPPSAQLPALSSEADKTSATLSEAVLASQIVPAMNVPAQTQTTVPRSEVQLPAAIPPAVKYRSKLLPIQPTITSHAVPLIQDLAAQVPSAPQTPQAPTPAKSSGALGGLTAVLASTVVPQSILAQLQGVITEQVDVTVAGGLLLLGLVCVGLYTVRLRRSGFAHAARSDVAASVLSAVVHNLRSVSYASVIFPPHNSIFMAFKREVSV